MHHFLHFGFSLSVHLLLSRDSVFLSISLNQTSIHFSLPSLSASNITHNQHKGFLEYQNTFMFEFLSQRYLATQTIWRPENPQIESTAHVFGKMSKNLFSFSLKLHNNSRKQQLLPPFIQINWEDSGNKNTTISILSSLILTFSSLYLFN